ncbi:MAG: hypothetical protein QOK37_3114 [Thermoanaerobaculia bacterium]|jgi:serine/threonine protein kinase/formylglycine-generating enzyme required for sulfatase activity/dienelactone hydrolase|nr:hypothetical protein [Thermoanaerobaculia bacterium]
MESDQDDLATLRRGDNQPNRAGSDALIGSTIAQYHITGRLGSGGMGVVYRAEDSRLGRTVALKFLSPELTRDPEAKLRFEREARAASKLDHPNICTIHEFGETGDGQMFLAMSCYDGESLAQKAARGPMGLDEAIPIIEQIARGLGNAHSAGIVHRDIKPANVMMTTDGIAKILDFGLAKLTAGASITRSHATLGTAAYMAPEQIRGEHVGPQADIWALGIVAFELLTGTRPFRGEYQESLVYSILNDQPPSVPDHPDVNRIIQRMLQKDPRQRYQTVDEVLRDLNAIETSASTSSHREFQPASRRTLWIAATVFIIILGSVSVWIWSFWQHEKELRWARETALPQIQSLADAEKYDSAVALAGQVEGLIPGDPVLAKVWPKITTFVTIQTTPSGAEVSYTDYGQSKPWRAIGRTPVTKARIPRGVHYRFRFEKPGFQSVWRLFPSGFSMSDTAEITVPLDNVGSIPSRMVRVPDSDYTLRLVGAPPVRLDDYLIDQYEVTNADYKRFVDAGAYRKAEYWKEPFVRDGRNVPWQDAVASFQDSSGRPGPATWEGGTFPKGHDQYPVGGVSWYEAAAFAQFAGKSLPTIYHWEQPAQIVAASLVVPRSNFGTGPMPVGSNDAMSGFGTFDMSGNVKEWCANEAEGNQHYILGGGWGEADYMAVDRDVQSPWQRRPQYGFRCMKQLSRPSAMAARPIPAENVRDHLQEKPVSDELFRAYERQYTYDKSPLNATAENVDRSPDDWTVQKVSMDAAYGNERLTAYLYLPKRASPPFQVIVYFPGGFVIHVKKFVERWNGMPDYVMRDRAFLFPVYKGTFERNDALKSDTPDNTPFYRDHMIAWYRDMARSIDYLETRKDIDTTKLAYLGLSWGAERGPVLVALEHRFRAAIFIGGGFDSKKAFPETDQVNFAPRVTIPVLMLNGRYDPFFPELTSQNTMFDLLGTPASNKRHIVYLSGHNPPRPEMIRETLAWLDRYLGNVR